jgi:hypothetical protein
MGRSGMKRSRRGGRRQHLPKVGARDELRHEQHLGRVAVADTLGVGGAAPWVKWAAVAIGGLLVIAALVALIGLF